MEFRDGVRHLRAIISPKSGGDADTLRERVEEIRLALEKRAGGHEYQRWLIKNAVSRVVSYIEAGKPPGDLERHDLYMALHRLDSAANFDTGRIEH